MASIEVAGMVLLAGTYLIGLIVTTQIVGAWSKRHCHVPLSEAVHQGTCCSSFRCLHIRVEALALRLWEIVGNELLSAIGTESRLV